MNVHFSSDKHEWRTPPDLFWPLAHKYKFTVDAAASHLNHLLPHYWTIEDDALRQDWSGERVWCNPPYGREQKKFIIKAASREADLTMLLIPARTDTVVWHDYIFNNADDVQFLRGRLKFSNALNSAPFPSALILYLKDEL